MFSTEIIKTRFLIKHTVKTFQQKISETGLKTAICKKETRIILLLCFATFSFFKAGAQSVNTGQLSGKVVDEQKRPLGYVSIAVLKAKDSTLVKGSMTDDQGSYIFKEIADGNYLIVFNSIGYAKTYKGPYTIDSGHENYQIDNVQLSPTSKQLNNVNIVSSKPLIETQIDKTVLNVENSVLAAGNTALEILQKAPGVFVDKDGLISLNGKQGVTVMLDGKPTYLSSDQLADLLRATQGDAIKSIELIANPSAKYDAAGSAGVINIKLKKNSNYGTNGTVIAGVGYGKYDKANTGLTLNHREKKFNIFGNLNYAYNKRFQDVRLDRVNTSGTDQTFFNQDSPLTGIRNNTNYKAGLDYFIDDKNTIGFAVNGSLSKGHDNSDPLTKIGSRPMEVDSVVKANDSDHYRFSNITYNLNYRGIIDTAGQEINVDADYSVYDRSQENDYNNYFFNNVGQPVKSDIFRNSTPSTIKIWALKADYTYPFSKQMKLDAGLKSSFVNTDNNSIFENYLDNSWQNDVTQSNHFLYSENINAAYANLKREFTSTTVQIGLRAEQTNSKGNSITAQTEFNRHYLNLFPSVFVNQVLSTDNEIGFSFSRRIDRPSYQDLNPFTRFLDLYSSFVGNPFLKPEYTNKFEVSYSYKKTLNIALEYSRTNDVMEQITLSDTIKKTLVIIPENLAQKTYYSLNISYPLAITKWWNTDNNVLLFDNKYSSPNIFGLPYSSGKLSIDISSVQTVTIDPTLTMEATLRYVSAQLFGTIIGNEIHSIDLGFNKSLDNKKFNVKFAVSDVLNQLKYKITSNLPSQNYTYNNRPVTRIFRLTGTYHFGSTKIKSAPQHEKGSEEEQQRVKP